MSVSTFDRNKSKVEFEEAYFKIYSDVGFITDNNFGIKCALTDSQRVRILSMTERITKVVSDIGTYIRIANSIYPKCKAELDARRTAQDKAIGLCFDLLTKYQNIFHEYHVGEEKYVDQIKHIRHEINCLKGWRESDGRRFTFG